MPYTTRHNKDTDKWEIVNPEGQVVSTRTTEEAADSKVDALEIRDGLDSVHGRLPAKEMTAEEKAEAYDKLMAERRKGGSDNEDGEKEKETSPPPPDPKKETSESNADTSKKKSGGYWGGAYQNA